MNFGLKTVVATTFLAIASTSAMAQIVVPPQPAPGPAPAPSTNNGGLLVAAWDNVRGVSLVQYLGLRLDDVRPDADMTANGTLLNFGTLSQYGSVFGASALTDIEYLVVAADSTGSGQAGKNIAVTIAGSATSYAINNTATSGAANQLNQFFTNGLLGTGGCNGVNPCVATTSGDLQYAGAGINGLGPRLGGQLPVSSAGVVGSVLHFAFIGQSGTAPSGQAPTLVYQNASSGNYGEWLLTTGGQLTYSVAGGAPVVPLPAAVWLLLSGLAGMGVVGRRKTA